MTLPEYTPAAVERARQGAIDWLGGDDDGYPRSREQETRDRERRGYDIYETAWEAPPIFGYEALEREGVVVRMETIPSQYQERVHFRRIGDLPSASAS